MQMQPRGNGGLDAIATYHPPSHTDMQVMMRAERDRIVDQLNRYRISCIGALALVVFIAMPVKREFAMSMSVTHWGLLAIAIALLVAMIINCTNTSSADRTAELVVRNRFLPLMPAEIELLEDIKAASDEGARAVATIESRVPHLRSHEYQLLVEHFGHTVRARAKQVR